MRGRDEGMGLSPLGLGKWGRLCGEWVCGGGGEFEGGGFTGERSGPHPPSGPAPGEGLRSSPEVSP